MQKRVPAVPREVRLETERVVTLQQITTSDTFSSAESLLVSCQLAIFCTLLLFM